MHFHKIWYQCFDAIEGSVRILVGTVKQWKHFMNTLMPLCASVGMNHSYLRDINRRQNPFQRKIFGKKCLSGTTFLWLAHPTQTWHNLYATLTFRNLPFLSVS
jgi:hypothetical protein